MRVICPLLKAWKLRPKRSFGFGQLVYQMERVPKTLPSRVNPISDFMRIVKNDFLNLKLGRL